MGSSHGLVLDIQAVQSVETAERGIPRYILEQTLALMAYPGLVRSVVINPHRPFPGHLPAELIASPLLSWNTASNYRLVGRAGPVAYYNMWPIDGIGSYDGIPADSVTTPHGYLSGNPVISTLYDLIPLKMRDYYLADTRTTRRYQQRMDVLRQADLLLALSSDSRFDAIHQLNIAPERIVVIGGGVSPYFRPSQETDDPWAEIHRALPNVRGPFVLSVTGSDPRKNTEGLLSGFAALPSQLRAQYQLVVTCRLLRDFGERWLAHTRSLGLTGDQVILTDYISDATLRALYQTTSLFVFPSRFEGFGLPVAEAIACGAPSITSDTCATPEILEWGPSTFDPLDSRSIAAAMERALVDTDFRDELLGVGAERSRLHTWPNVAQRTVEALDLLPKPRSARTLGLTHRRRLALLGSMPPESSGAAEYNARLVAALANRCSVDVFATTHACSELFVDSPNVRQFPRQALGSTLSHAGYDALIYSVDDGEHHHETLELARRYPGVVWFHDIHLGRSIRSPLSSADSDGDDRYGLGYTAEWLQQARAVLVNTSTAARLLQFEQGTQALLPPLWELPLAMPACVATEDPNRDDPALIVCAGQLDRGRQAGTIIEALRLVRSDFDARLVFVGPIADPEHQHELQRLAADIGVGDMVSFLGFLPRPQFDLWLQRATCAVQIYQPNLDGTPFIVTDCLAAGLPVVTNLAPGSIETIANAVSILPAEPTSATLSLRIGELLDRGPAWQRHHAAARQVAESFTFDRLADQVLRALDSTLEREALSERGIRHLERDPAISR